MSCSKLALCPEMLSNLSVDVKVPQYDRSKLSIGIYHFGFGGFHRAHQALIMDNLLNMGLAHDWAICGVGLMARDEKMHEVMTEQGGLYTLVEKEANGHFNYRVIGSVIEYLFAPDDVEEVIERLTATSARIVSLTITEGGYNLHPATGEFDLSNVQHDIKNPRNPKTVFGIVIEALRRRKERGMNGFTIMSCDNLQENGKIARKAFTGYAETVDPLLAAWMVDHVSFPSSMVDRITPVTTEVDRKTTAKKIGCVDAWPVVCEPFLQWVQEDSFVAGRPPFEKTEVQLVGNVEPFELMKLRLLNVSHQAIAYFGLMMGFELVHDVAQDKQIVAFLKAYMDLEATKTLKPLTGIDLTLYKAKIVERFQNPNLRDLLSRLAFDGSDRIVKFVLPVIHDNLAAGRGIHLCTAIIASFLVYLDGLNDEKKPLNVSIDRMFERLSMLTKRLHKDPTAIVSEVEIFGEIVKNQVFLNAFTEIYPKIRAEGSRKTLTWLLARK